MNDINQYFLNGISAMELERLSNKLLVLTEGEKSIAVKRKDNIIKEPTHETVTLSDFLNTFLNTINANINVEKISTLELSNCQLADLPIFFENLNLKHLNLSQNKLKTVPACIYSGLEFLEYLDLGYNSIQNFDYPPASILNIKVIKLNNNSLSKVPKWIVTFQSVNLEELNFSFNKATSYDYNKNSYNIDVMKLNKLELRNSQLIDKDIDFLKCFRYLEYLDISNEDYRYINKFYEPDNLFVKPKWKQLKILYMNNLSISLFPEGILWTESLTELHINQNCISWIPNDIKYMVNLRVLDISQNTLIAISDEVTKLELLEVLLASHNSIEICPDFKEMESLNTLDLYDNLLEHVSINCDKLKSFDLDQNYLDTSSFPSYSVKRNDLRKHFPSNQMRANTQKIIDDRVSGTYSERNSEDDSSSESFSGDVSVTHKILVDDAEDWDSPTPIRNRSPDIDSEDDTWDGEDGGVVCTKSKVRQKVYIEDEDWMFEDVD